MGMLGGSYVTSRASRCASTPAFWFSSCSFRITSVLGNVCSQFKIHSRLCFGSMSCRGFEFFGFPCLRFSSSLLSPFFSRFFSTSLVLLCVLPCSESVKSYSVFGFNLSFSVFMSSLSFSPPSQFFDSSISSSNSGSSLSLRHSVKVVHVFVSSNSGSSLFRLWQFKGCPHLCFSSSCRSSCHSESPSLGANLSVSQSVLSLRPRFRTQIPVRLCPCTV
jgi:hypothetical protein